MRKSSHQSANVAVPDDLSAYFSKLREIETAWVEEEIRAIRAGRGGRICGTSRWNAHRPQLARLDRQHGVAPNDRRVYSIAAYRLERARIESAWERQWDRRRQVVNPSKKALDREFFDLHRHNCRIDDLHGRLFGRLLVENGHETKSPRYLWAHIVLFEIPQLEIWRQSSDARSRNANVERVMAALHKLRIPWSVQAEYQPPYPALSHSEAIDRLRSIANRLEFDDSVETMPAVRGAGVENVESGEKLPRSLDAAPTHPRRSRFKGGQLTCFSDRLELCQVEICRGRRPKWMRDVIELLRQKGPDGTFVAYESSRLAEKLSVDKSKVGGLIRGLRVHITSVLSEEGIDCGHDEIILSGGPGYRLSQKLSVQERGSGDPSSACEENDPITGRLTDPLIGRLNDRMTKKVASRRAQILQVLIEGHKLGLPAIAQHIRCPLATVRRDMNVLRASGLVEFLGAKKTGYYAVRQPLLPSALRAESLATREATTVSAFSASNAST